MLNDLPFIDKINTVSLWPQYKELQDFVFATVKNAVDSASSSNDELPSTAYMFVQFVQNDKEKNLCSELVKLLSFCVAFPVSEAIVESWGSTISHLYAIGHNPSEPNNDLHETGTIDRLTFVGKTILGREKRQMHETRCVKQPTVASRAFSVPVHRPPGYRCKILLPRT